MTAGRRPLRVLITGANGQLGRDLVRAFDDGTGRYDLVLPSLADLELTVRDSVLAAVCAAEPDVVIHTAAWTAVDACETNKDLALQVNALGTRHVQEAARIVGARVTYVSTDYVFDGTGTCPIDEWEATNPLSVYGRSKLAGERELDPGATVVRLAWLAGAGGPNFISKMLELAASQEEVRVVADQFGSPSFAADVAGTIRRLVVGRLPGVFHVTNAGAASWYDVACATFAEAGLDPARVTPITTADYPTPARRPAYSVLDNAALRLQGLPLLPDWRESLGRLVKELTS